MKRMIAVALLAIGGGANGQDLSSLKLCSFDFDVSNSKIGFPDRVVDITADVKEWQYPAGKRLIFERRYLTEVRVEGVESRRAEACDAIQIADAEKSLKPVEKPSSNPVAKKKVVAVRVPIKKGVSIGMTVKEVLDSSWGRPEDINRTTTRYGTREQWVYGSRNYLYFENGRLTAIQN